MRSFTWSLLCRSESVYRLENFTLSQDFSVVTYCRITGFTHIALEITDKKAVELHLKEAGIPITETVELPDGTVFFFIRDPDANVIEFHRPA